ncbi:hypothetical protein HPSNT_03625 [Helicobacter pylori SNT49]|uniref:Uncharacterized protein n=1 Tax=Helicobacter pylori SNT49 TaxID=1055530 RepID=G2MEB5_HELPX|nr:hypothetical protein HPSNT_03625 [Helicobacter pylori SNT49]
MLANDFVVKKLKNKELHGLLCNKLSKRVNRFGYRVIGVGVDKETNEVIVQLSEEAIVRLNSKTALHSAMVALIKSLMFLTIRMVILSIADCLSLRN